MNIHTIVAEIVRSIPAMALDSAHNNEAFLTSKLMQARLDGQVDVDPIGRSSMKSITDMLTTYGKLPGESLQMFLHRNVTENRRVRGRFEEDLKWRKSIGAITVFKDGNMWCAVWPDFENLQESPAEFGKTPSEAVDLLQTTKP